MVNSSIFLSRCIFNRKPRWKTFFFISVEFFTEQKRHRGPWNKCIYAAYSACGMQCVPNRFQITSFVNVRPSLSAPMHFDLRRERLSHRVWCAETRTVIEPRCSNNYHIFHFFKEPPKTLSSYLSVIRWERWIRKTSRYNIQCTVITRWLCNRIIVSIKFRVIQD